MKPSGSRAYGYARVRAWKSRLLTREDVAPLLTATDAASVQRALAVLGPESSFQRLLRIYEVVIRTNRASVPLFRTMLRLHEIENVKLLWRAVVRHRDRDRTRKLWIPFGSLATIPTSATVAATLRELADALADTAFSGIANDVLRAYADDLSSAELAFDRWASRQLFEEIRKLPRTESLARHLLELVIRERDSEILRRGEKSFGLSAAATRAAAGTQVSDDPQLLRKQRLRICRRALRGDPFTLAPIVGLILLAEEEVRAVRALVERQGDAALDAPLARAIAGSQIAP
ncbi:MAG TPA: V-type ATPase subunit [Thermoanaerobaculia bacterium]|nr:V-type ATPase subunit [Thermoanaerobaculia bacterium]